MKVPAMGTTEYARVLLSEHELPIIRDVHEATYWQPAVDERADMSWREYTLHLLAIREVEGG